MHTNLLQNWLKESENELNELKRTNSLLVFNREYANLINLVIDLFEEIIPKLISTAEQIQSILYAPYERLSIDFPQEVTVKIFNTKELRIPFTKDKIENSRNFFPEIKEVESILNRILQNLEDEPVRIIKVVRSNLEVSLEEIDDEVRTLEKVIVSVVPNIEVLLNGYRKIAESKYLRNYLKQFKPNQLSVKFQTIDRAKQVIEDFRRRTDKVCKFTFDLGGLFDFELNQVDLSKWYKEKIETEEMERKGKEIQNRISFLVKQIDEIVKNETKSNKMKNLLSEMNPEFPVNLERIAELVGEEKTVAEETLVYTLNKYPQIGKYDSMSQMVVFSDKVTKKQQKKEKKIKCPECKSDLKNTENKCPNCGKEFELCPICRGIVTSEKTLKCSSCGRLFHKEHLEEWMNTNRNCPVCKEKL